MSIRRRKTILAVILAAVVILAGCEGGGAGSSALDAVRVEGTRQAVQLEATRQSLALEATAIAVERARVRADQEAARAAMSQPFVVYGPWVLLALGVLACGVVGWQFVQVYLARARVIRRQPHEGEPLMVLDKNRFALPLRSAGVYQDLTRGQERAPLLAHSTEAQERTTAQQQGINLVLATLAGEVVKALRGGGDVNLMLPSAKEERAQPTAPTPSPVKVLQEPTLEVDGWIDDVKRPLLLEVSDDD